MQEDGGLNSVQFAQLSLPLGEPWYPDPVCVILASAGIAVATSTAAPLAAAATCPKSCRRETQAAPCEFSLSLGFKTVSLDIYNSSYVHCCGRQAIQNANHAKILSVLLSDALWPRPS
jgi:hypothetical protein